MKRERVESTTSASSSFFALAEASSMLLLPSCDPLLVATLLQLNHALRRGVWLTLCEPRLCNGVWVQRFLRRLWSLVRPRTLMLCTTSLELSPHPEHVFMMPCRHAHADRMLLARVVPQYSLGGWISVEESSHSDDDDGETESHWDRWRSRSLVAFQSKWDDSRTGTVHWQHARCTDNQFLFEWRYVARALSQRVDALIASKNCAQRAQALTPEGRWLFV